jgi:polyhydroxyalkanoate synthesis regulator protein
MLSSYLEQSFTTMLRQQETMQAEMTKALQATALAPLTSLARKNMELWEQMQQAAREAFTGRTPGSKADPDDNAGK